MTIQGWLWSADGAAVALVVLAGVAESRRSKRRDLEHAGWMPWRGLQVAGFFAVLVLSYLAVRA